MAVIGIIVFCGAIIGAVAWLLNRPERPKDPREDDDNYMANLKQQARVERLKQQGDKLSLKKTKFVDDGQLEFG